jgi:hypothetical protein
MWITQKILKIIMWITQKILKIKKANDHPNFNL